MFTTRLAGLVVMVAALSLAACGGSDSPTCQPGFTDCGGVCASLHNDADNCGACGNACASSAVCRDGACATLCPAGQTLCGGACVNLRNDAANCGACGTTCGPTQVCGNGACAVTCPAGQTLCDGACVNTLNDVSHCGACGTACATGQVCGNGSCASQCPFGQTLCDGACVNTDYDGANCGACGVACGSPQLCLAGSCQTFCPAGQTLCDGACVDTLNDPAHCGACGTACGAAQQCLAGSCQTTCPAGQTLCDGACVSTRSDPAHCGACGTTCGSGQVCSAGACADFCTPGETICGGGCVNLQTDASNCGTCGVTCGPGKTCQAGACAVSCEASLFFEVHDAWGLAWDGLERSAATYASAKAACEAIGGRLPIATELYRVSANKWGLPTPAATGNYLWSLVPYTNGGQVVVRLSDAAVGGYSTGSTTPYRCVCPAPAPSSFTGSNCFGAPGQECFATRGGAMNVDGYDRAPLTKGAAIWECALSRAHLPDHAFLTEAILAGLGNGSGNWLHLADDVYAFYDVWARWSGQDTSWNPDAYTALSNTTSFTPFRCAGWSSPTGTHPNTVANEYVGAPGGYKGETLDSSPSPFVNAEDACWDRGGHLPRSTELVESIQQGLPNGTNAFLWTSEEAYFAQPYALVLRWSGTAPWYLYDATLYPESGPTMPFRCLYYPLDSGYSGPASCNGGCTKFTLAGATPAVIWFDTQDRAPASLADAAKSCAALGGRLPSQRDYTEAIRHGLPNGTGSYLRSSDVTFSGSLYSSAVRWVGTDPSFNPGIWGSYGYVAYPFNAAYPYRCMWTNELR